MPRARPSGRAFRHHPAEKSIERSTTDRNSSSWRPSPTTPRRAMRTTPRTARSAPTCRRRAQRLRISAWTSAPSRSVRSARRRGRIYRSEVNASQLKLLATIANNTATTIMTDSTADGSLGENAPIGRRSRRRASKIRRRSAITTMRGWSGRVRPAPPRGTATPETRRRSKAACLASLRDRVWLSLLRWLIRRFATRASRSSA